MDVFFKKLYNTNEERVKYILIKCIFQWIFVMSQFFTLSGFHLQEAFGGGGGGGGNNVYRR